MPITTRIICPPTASVGEEVTIQVEVENNDPDPVRVTRVYPYGLETFTLSSTASADVDDPDAGADWELRDYYGQKVYFPKTHILAEPGEQFTLTFTATPTVPNADAYDEFDILAIAWATNTVTKKKLTLQGAYGEIKVTN